MITYMRKHEDMVLKVLSRGRVSKPFLIRLVAYHEQQTGIFQHERLIHLLVTLAISLFLLLVFGFLLVRPGVLTAGLAILFFALETGYIIHYFKLENCIQRLYSLGNRIRKRAGLVAGNY